MLDIENVTVPYLQGHYDEKFAVKFWEVLSNSLLEHERHWIYLRHKTRFHMDQRNMLQDLQLRMEKAEKAIVSNLKIPTELHNRIVALEGAGAKAEMYRSYIAKCVPHGAGVIVYGAGEVGRQVFVSILGGEPCILRGWVDKEFISKGYPVADPKIVKTTPYEAILICIEKEDIRDEIKGQLAVMGVSFSRMVWIPKL